MTDTRSAAARVRAFLEERGRKGARGFDPAVIAGFNMETLYTADLEELSREPDDTFHSAGDVLTDVLNEAHIAEVPDEDLVDVLLETLRERGWELRRVPR